MHSKAGYLGLALVLLGATLLASPTLGFETIAADRTTEVSTAQDPDALLGVVDNSGADEANIQNSNDESILYYLNDNAGEFPSAGDIQAEAVSFGGESTELIATVESSDTHDYEIVVDCGGADHNTQGTVTVAIQASGDVDVDFERTTTESIDVNCRGGGNGGDGPPNFSAGNAQQNNGQWSQTFEFSADAIDSNGAATIDLSDAQSNSGVDYSNANAVLTTGSNNNDDASFDQSTQELTYLAQGNPSETIVITLNGLSVTGYEDGTAEYTDGVDRQAFDSFSVSYVVDEDQSGDIDASGDVQAGNRVTVGGDVDAEGDLTTGDGVAVDGDTEIDGNLQTGNSPTFDGDVDAGGDISTGDRTNVSGDVDTGGDLGVGMNGDIAGDIETGGAVDLSRGTTIGGAVDAGDALTVGNGATIDGDIDAAGDVVLGDRVTVNGAIEAGGSVTFGSDVTIGDDVDAVGDVEFSNRATVEGDLTTDGTVYGSCGTVDGDVDADGDEREC